MENTVTEIQNAEMHKITEIQNFIFEFSGLKIILFSVPNIHPRHRHPPSPLPITAWVRLNRLRTGVGRFRSCLHIWVGAPSAACECGAEEHTADHVVFQCPIHRPACGVHTV